LIIFLHYLLAQLGDHDSDVDDPKLRNDNVRAGSFIPVADFSYDRKWIMRSSLFLAVAFVWVILMIIFVLPFDLVVTSVMGIALTVFFIVVGVSPLLTKHTIGDNGIILRQGWHFSINIPLDNLKAINFIDEAPKDRGLLISQTRGILNITSSKMGLVSLKLRRQQRFASVFWRKAHEIVLDVTDREGFRQAIEKELATTPANPDRLF
jgi:hypothetical protein